MSAEEAGTGRLVFGARLTIQRLGQRGEGIANHDGALVYVPHALPGEVVLADVDGDRGSLNLVETSATNRVAAICKHYGTCGGCALQVLAPQDYLAWKRSLVSDALAREGVPCPVGDIIAAHGEGRRRVTFHARINTGSLAENRIALGFMRARSHDIVDIDACPVLSPELGNAADIARSVARTMSALGKPLDIVVTATQSGLDVDMRGAGALNNELRIGLTRLAETLDLARIANHGDIIIERRAPSVPIGNALLNPPPGAFLQATALGEQALAGLVMGAARGSKRIADLFAGVGTFALRLAELAPVEAVENDAAALLALSRAANFAPGLKGVSVQERDLFRRPLTDKELDRFDCVVFDPPRAGAQAQAQQLAKSGVRKVISVSCNAQTFARDARLLMDGGYTVSEVTPVDQFLYSPHVEMVGVFTKSVPVKKRRSLLG
jgi:23S rRNA (uracil1939-C5)-methyltransferase